MGSKKLKRKKLKCKKMEKVHTVKARKRIKSRGFTENVDKNLENDLETKSISCDRSSRNNYSLSYEETSEIKNFSKIREDYFLYLQSVICDNCAFHNSVVTDETLKDLALELEQNALLACLQVDIYKKSMCKIIRDIKKSTEEKQVHEEVKKLLPDTIQEKNDSIKSEKCTSNPPENEGYSRIPTIDSIRDDKELRNSTNFWMEESSYNSDFHLVSDQEICNENQNMISTAQPWAGNETYSSAIDYSSYWNNETTQANETNVNEHDIVGTVDDRQSSASEKNFSAVNQKDNVCPQGFNNNEVEFEKVDPLLLSRNHLQKLVEETLKVTEKIQKQKKDEQERAQIAQILEGDDSLDDRLNDSLSDNENESKENIDETNLLDRLEKMRELFGVEEEDNSKNLVLEKPKPDTKHSSISNHNNNLNHNHNHNHHTNSWRHEKYIQLYKYSLIAGEMTYERRKVNRKIFLELFGEDSDEEHEKDYSSKEKYRASCVERISSWVVKSLMPFYHDKRILGRNVFKTLGHHISDTIVDEIQYPDEWTVKYFVSKFFPPKKKYASDADVLNFQLD